MPQEFLDQQARELELFKFVQTAAHIGLWYSDPQDVGKLVWTDETYRIFGYTKDTFDGRIETFFQSVYSEDQYYVRQASHAALDPRTRSPYNVEHRIIRPDGSMRWVHQEGKVIWGEDDKAIQFVGIVQDITDRKEAEQRIKKSEERFRKLVQNSADVVQLVGKDNIILYVSPSVINVLGYQPEEMMHRPSSDFVHPDDLAVINEKREQFIHGATSIPGFQHRIKHKDGHYIWVESIAQNQLDEPGIEAILVNYHDITERKLAEDKLKEERELFKALVQNSNDVLELVGKDMRAKYVSPAVTRLLGFTQEEFLGGLLGSRIHPEEQERLKEEVRNLVQHPSEPMTVEHRIRHKDGHWVWIEATASNRFESPAVEAIVLNYRGIDERHNTQEKLEEQKQFIEQVFDTLPDLITMKDRDGILLLANETAAKFLEAPKEQIMGKPTIDVHKNPDEVALYLADDRIAIDKGLTVVRDEPFTKKDGTKLWLHVVKKPYVMGNGKVVSLAVATDITGIKKAEEKLLSQQEFTQAIIDNVHDLVFIISPKGDMHFKSKSLEKTLELSYEDLKDNNLFTIIHDEDIHLIQDAIAKTSLQQRVQSIDELRMKKKDGLWRSFTVVLVNLLDNTTVSGIAVYAHDITKEQEVDRARNQFVSLASHQLRTPLTSIRWYGELLLSKASDLPAELRGYATEIVQSNERMIHLVNSLLNASRAELSSFSVTPTAIDVVSLMKDVVKEADVFTRKKHVTIREHYDSSVGIMMIDRDLLFMVVANLLSNAIEYNKEYGDVDIALTGKEDAVELTMSDTGVGIPEAEKDKLFTKLFRADNARLVDPNGTGMGLYIVKLILDRVGGSISVKSTEKGTTFTVLLPKKGMTASSGTWRLAR